MTPDTPDPLRHFVREVLGCTCPEDVLHDIRVEAPPAELADLPVERVLAVGGRLLVLVCERDYRATDPSDLLRLGTQASKLRDARGFNRVRIVLVAKYPAAADGPLPQFPARDDRLHWHRVPVSDLEQLVAR